MAEYIENIAVFIILEGIILKLVTNEEYKKYVKMCSGMILIILIVSPLNKVTGFLNDIPLVISGMVNDENYDYVTEKIGEKTEKIEIENFIKTYEETIFKDIKEDDYVGSCVNDVNLIFDENEADYVGEIVIYVTDQCTFEEKEYISRHINEKYGFDLKKTKVRTI